MDWNSLAMAWGPVAVDRASAAVVEGHGIGVSSGGRACSSCVASQVGCNSTLHHEVEVLICCSCIDVCQKIMDLLADVALNLAVAALCVAVMQRMHARCSMCDLHMAAMWGVAVSRDDCCITKCGVHMLGLHGHS